MDMTDIQTSFRPFRFKWDVLNYVYYIISCVNNLLLAATIISPPSYCLAGTTISVTRAATISLCPADLEVWLPHGVVDFCMKKGNVVVCRKHKCQVCKEIWWLHLVWCNVLYLGPGSQLYVKTKRVSLSDVTSGILCSIWVEILSLPHRSVLSQRYHLSTAACIIIDHLYCVSSPQLMSKMLWCRVDLDNIWVSG